MAVSIEPQRIGLFLGLVVLAFASSSFAKSNSTKPVCAANMGEVRSKMADVPGCNEASLRSQFNKVPRGKLNGQGLASAYTIEVPANALQGNFKIRIDGVVAESTICCSQGGVWAVQGYGPIKINGRTLSIGGYRFSPAESGELLPVFERSTSQSGSGVS